MGQKVGHNIEWEIKTKGHEVEKVQNAEWDIRSNG